MKNKRHENQASTISAKTASTFRPAFALSLTAALTSAMLFCGCGFPKQYVPSTSAPSAESASPLPAAAETQVNETANPEALPDASPSAETASASQGDDQGMVTGVVVDAAMHSVFVQTKDGELKIYSYPEEMPDTSGLSSEGIQIGMGIGLDLDEDGHVTAMKSVDTAANDTEALEGVANLVLAANSDDFDSFVMNVSFPMTTEGGTKVFKEDFTEDKYWTEPVKSLLAHLDLTSLEKEGDKIVIAGTSGSPKITVSKTEDGWLVTDMEL